MPLKSRTLARRVSIGQYPSGDGVRVTQCLARELGCTEPTAHRRLYVYPTIRDLMLGAIRAYRRAGATVGLSRFLAPIEAEISRVDGLKLDIQLATEAQLADANEETAVQTYLLRENRGTAIAAIRAIDTERAAQLRLRQAIAAKWELL